MVLTIYRGISSHPLDSPIDPPAQYSRADPTSRKYIYRYLKVLIERCIVDKTAFQSGPKLIIDI
jgi:hypothetical protein